MAIGRTYEPAGDLDELALLETIGYKWALFAEAFIEDIDGWWSSDSDSLIDQTWFLDGIEDEVSVYVSRDPETNDRWWQWEVIWFGDPYAEVMEEREIARGNAQFAAVAIYHAEAAYRKWSQGQKENC